MQISNRRQTPSPYLKHLLELTYIFNIFLKSSVHNFDFIRYPKSYLSILCYFCSTYQNDVYRETSSYWLTQLTPSELITIDDTPRDYIFNQAAIKKLPRLPFLLNLLLLNNKWTNNYPVTKASFNNFFIKPEKLPAVINPTVFIKQWGDVTNFIANFFLFCSELLIFTPPFFKHETASFNWHFNTFEFDFWKYHVSFFFNKIINFSHKVEHFYRKLKDFDCETVIITDSNYHDKSLFYLNRFFFFSIGLADTSTNPTKISYPITILQLSYFSQFFFIKLIIWGYRLSASLVYKNQFNIWKTYKLLHSSVH